MDPAYRALAKLSNVTFLNNSRAGADDYADWIGIPRDRIKVVHNGIDFGDQGRLAPDAIRSQRNALGIQESDFVVGGVFRFEKEKQPLLWIEVASEVRARRAGSPLPHLRSGLDARGHRCQDQGACA